MTLYSLNYLNLGIKSLLIIFTVLIGVAYFTLLERKLLSSIQRRRGPNIVGISGIIQPLSDGFKLFIKEMIIPSSSDKLLFILAPLITFILSLLIWGVIPTGQGMVMSNLPLGLLFIFAISSLEVYGIIIAGWASNSRYAFLGTIRTVAQMISYEISIGFVLISIVLVTKTLNLTEIVLAQKDMWLIIPLFPMFLIFIISILAETNRHPFDLPEAESELVSGYNIEYSGISFALFFLGEYSSMFLMSSLTVILFLGGWTLFGMEFGFLSPFIFGFKVCLFLFFFVWARSSLPRYRYDQLMRLGWKIFCPITLGWVVFVGSYVVFIN